MYHSRNITVSIQQLNGDVIDVVLTLGSKKRGARRIIKHYSSVSEMINDNPSYSEELSNFFASSKPVFVINNSVMQIFEVLKNRLDKNLPLMSELMLISELKNNQLGMFFDWYLDKCEIDVVPDTVII